MKTRQKQKTAKALIRVYCKAKHRKRSLCDSCSELFEYVAARLEKCHLPEETSSCFMCPEYCYHPDMRKKIQTVMHFSTPRILIYHPILTFQNLRYLKKIHRHLLTGSIE